MKYLFFDIECANGGQGTICSFGYVIANMDFQIVEQKDIIMNPEGRFYLTGRSGRPDIKLAYPIDTFKKSPKFPACYESIKTLIENEEHYVIGHSVHDDVMYLNKACARYGLEPFKFRYFDTQRMYREVMEDKRQISLANALLTLGVEDKFKIHRSDEDARATMLLLKALLKKANMSFELYNDNTDRCIGRTENGRSVWDYISPEREYRRPHTNKLKSEKKENLILRGRKNHRLFLRYLDFGEGIGEKSDKLAGKKVTVSLNYETEHFKEMVILSGLIKAAGGEYVLSAAKTDIFAAVDAKNEDGTSRRCARGEYVLAEIEKGRNIEIITLDQLLSLLGTSIAALEAMPALDIDYLLDDKYKKSATA